MGYSIGAFDVEYLNSSPIFVMSNGDGKVQAFANMMTIKNTDILSIDLMRHRNDSINSIMEMLFLSIANWGKDEDYKYFDIGIAPLSNEETSHILEQKKLIHMAYQYGNQIHGFIGLRNYKEKFHPEWSNVYIAYKEDRFLPEILLSLSGVCHNLID